MDDDSSSERNPWRNLLTITNFDKGSNLCSIKCINKSDKNKGGKITKLSSSTSASILIGTLINQLCSILEKDPARSKKLYVLLCDTMYKMKFIDPSYKSGGYELIQGRYMDAVYQLINAARATIGSENPLPSPIPLVTYVSPYQVQFKETGFIAGGGFGYVFKAVHKLDEVEYAIKKIIVKPGRFKTIFSYLEEVKTFAKLNHTNIVSYKQAWLEPMSTTHMLSCPSIYKLNSNDKPYDNQNFSKNLSYESHKNRKSYKFLNEDQNLKCHSQITDEKTSRTFESYTDTISFRYDENYDINIESNEENILEIACRSSTEESVSSDKSNKTRRICQYATQSNQLAILYIQMALCEKTLRQWIDERLEPTASAMVAAIVTQILCGLNYIHSLKIVHHDIKPSNIFISSTGTLQVQLGDFGLACPLQRDSHAVVGTCMYAAPEQLRGECNPKSDIYSLGIVILELIIPMQTSMECIKMVETIKSGQIPNVLTIAHPKWASMIIRLMQKNPANRPSTDEVLDDLYMERDLTINKLQNDKHKLQDENNKLKDENKAKDQIIMEQNSKIEELLAKLEKYKIKINT